MTIQEFERRLLAAAATVELEVRWAIEYGAIAIELQAKREIGQYHPALGPLPRWPSLRPSTLREKRRLGYAPPDNPLLRTGAMRAAITHSVSGPGEKIETRVGVNGVVAVVQERGGGRVPARSYLERAARRKERQMVERIATGVRRALSVR